jgi:NADPH:quinone reductase-like Zn-dependent oxidoreductase
MRALRLHTEGLGGLSLDDVEPPTPGAGEALVRVHAAGLTRGELTWPTDRLPAIPSYELSGVIAEVAPGGDWNAGDAVFGLTPFDRDGVAAELAALPVGLLARKPRSLSHVEAAVVPLAALSAWQAVFDHGRLQAGERALVTGAAGGVGHMAVQLARWRGAHVTADAPRANAALVRGLGADEMLADGASEPFDLVFDTAGGDTLREALPRIRSGARVVSIAEEPTGVPDGVEPTYFVVEPNGEQLAQVADLAERGDLRPMVESVFTLENGRAAFARTEAHGKRGKVVLRIAAED